MILATFTLQITLILPTRFPVSCPFGSGEVQIEFQDGSHHGFLIEMILTVFDLQVAPILSRHLAFWVGRAQNTFLRWMPTWITDRTNFS